MNLSLDQRIELMTRLGTYLSIPSGELEAVKEEASHKNGWFILPFIDHAITQISCQFLQVEKLEAWLAKYPGMGEPHPVRNVGIVMAGNIPAVGFHDLLCGIVSGHRFSIKLSSRDEVLLTHFIDKLKSWEPALKDQIQISGMLKGCDAYIATGSNNSARYFHYYFEKYPHIIRQNRTSVAVLDGSEDAGELEKLADDALSYFGLGCRNVTKLFVPAGYDFLPLLEISKKYRFLKDFHHYQNNFDYNLTVSLLNKEPYLSNEVLLLLERDAVFSRIGVLHYQTYKDRETLDSLLEENGNVQCVVGHGYLPMGQAQSPTLDDYADGVDTLKFLRGL